MRVALMLLSAAWLPVGWLPAALLTDRVEWGGVAGNYEFVAGPVSVASVLGQTVTVSQDGPVFQRLDQSAGWYGNFSPGEELLWTYFGGPMVFDFGAAGASGIEFQIQAEIYGAFTAQLELMDSSGAVVNGLTANGTSTPLGDGGALRLSLTNTAFQRARVRLIAGGDLNSFAVGAVSFAPGAVSFAPGGLATAASSQSAVPEPGTGWLAGTLGAVWGLRRAWRGWTR